MTLGEVQPELRVWCGALSERDEAHAFEGIGYPNGAPQPDRESADLW